MRKNRFLKIASIILLALVVLLGAGIYRLWSAYDRLAKQPPQERITIPYDEPDTIGVPAPETTTEPVTESPEASPTEPVMPEPLEATLAASVVQTTKPAAQTTAKPKPKPKPKPTTTAPPPTLAGEKITWARTQILMLCNVERKKENLAPLKYGENSLQKAADTRAKESSVLWKHARPDERKWDTVLLEKGVNVVKYPKAGENLAKGHFEEPERLVKAWMNSPDHRENILSAEFTEMTVGFYRSDDGLTYWSQMFLGR